MNNEWSVVYEDGHDWTKILLPHDSMWNLTLQKLDDLLPITCGALFWDE